MEEQFYVRIRGRVQGPYDTAKLQSLVKRGQLSRMHEVSTDRSLWRQAADFPELFTSPTVAAATTTVATKENYRAAEGDLEVETTHTTSSGEWFYALNQEQKGPVSFEQLKGLLQAGVLSGSSLVWKDGMAEWLSAEMVPNLRPFSASGSHSQSGSTESRSGLDSDTLRTLRETVPWVSFLVVCVITVCSLMVILGIVAVLSGVRDHETTVTAGGLFLLLYAFAGIWGGLLLNAYNSGVRKYLSARAPQVLEGAFRSLRSFWLYISIIVIIVLVNAICVAIWAFSVGMTFPA